MSGAPKAVPMAKPPRPSLFIPEGDSNLRDSILRALDALPAEQRLGAALAFAVRSLDSMGSHAISPAMKRLGSGTADAVRDLIPADVAEMMAQARERDGEGGNS